jgi:HSP20 family protein
VNSTSTVKSGRRSAPVRCAGRPGTSGGFDYRTTLPPNADTGHISAELDNGVLTVRVPRTGKIRAQRVDIVG